MDSEAIVTDRAAAAVFSGRRQRRILMALIEGERSLSDLSAVTDTPLNLVHYHVRRLIGLGLAAVEREEARTGRATKYYRACARRYFVPVELVKAAPGESMNLRLRDRLERGLARTIVGYSYSVDAGRPKIETVRGDGDGPPTAEMWLELRLSRADAAALSGDLRAIFKKYAARSAHPHHGYIVHAALAPT